MVHLTSLAFLLLCLGTFVQGDEDLPCISQDVDAYVDKVLEKARKEIPDPMRLPPKSTIVELKEGLVWGLSELYRKGKVEVECEGNSTVILSGKLAVDEIKGRYTWEKSSKSGFIVLMADDFEADVKLAVPRSEEHPHPRLIQFKIKSLKDVKTEITGHGYMTWALSEFMSFISGFFQRGLARKIQGPLREALEREMREIEL